MQLAAVQVADNSSSHVPDLVLSEQILALALLPLLLFSVMKLSPPPAPSLLCVTVSLGLVTDLTSSL